MFQNNVPSQFVVENSAQQQVSEPAADNQEAQGMNKIMQVGRILQMLAERGDQSPLSNAFVTPFHSHEVPNIDIILYYVVISHKAGLYANQAPAVLALIERLCNAAAVKGI